MSDERLAAVEQANAHLAAGRHLKARAAWEAIGLRHGVTAEVLERVAECCAGLGFMPDQYACWTAAAALHAAAGDADAAGRAKRRALDLAAHRPVVGDLIPRMAVDAIEAHRNFIVELLWD